MPLSIIVFLVSYRSLRGPYYYFDSKHNTKPQVPDGGSFQDHANRYFDITKLVIFLSGGIIAFLIGILSADKHSAAIQKLTWSVPIVIGFFGISMALLIGFLLSMTFWYEQYDHFPKHDSYKRWKYATTIALAWAGFFAFICGIGWLAQNLF
jgi:hypothetical protein